MTTAEEKQEKFISSLCADRPQIWKTYCELIEHEKMSSDEFYAYNWAKRLEIVRYAYERTSFYRRLYDDAGIHPDDIKSEKDWSLLPVVTKQMLRENLETMKVDNGASPYFKKNALLSASGGSTGKPVKFYADICENGSGAIFSDMRALGWWFGRDKGNVFAPEPILGQDEAWFVRMNVYPLLKSKAVRDEIARRLAPTKRYYLDVMEMDEKKIREFTEAANTGGLFYIMAYTGAAEEVARYYLEGKIERRFTPKALSVRATPCTVSVRETIESGFGCPVYDNYASNEFSNIAFEIPNANHCLRVCSDLRHIDIVDANGLAAGEGEEGTVVVTDFMNHVFPFIRYSLGDRTHFVNQNDDMPFPLIAPVKGRESDYVETKDGKRIYGLCCAFDEYPECVYNYQFVQKAPGMVILRVVPNRNYSSWEKDANAALNDLQRAAGDRVDYTLQYVDEIPHDEGKIRFIVYE